MSILSKEVFEDIYLEPLGEAEFVSLIPKLGFKVIKSGETPRTPPAFAANKVETALRLNIVKNGYVALPLQAEGYDLDDAIKNFEGEKLLCPVGEALKVRKSYFDIDKVPLFQEFANLKSEDEIVEFANKYGTLQGKMSLTLGEGAVFLEALGDWAREISLVNTALKLIEIYENHSIHEGRPWDNDLKVIEAGKVGGLYGIEGTPFCIEGPKPPKTGVDVNFFKLLLVMFFNRQLREHQSYPGYGFDSAGHFTSAIYPTSLASAIWLQLAQSFFGDAPNERMAKRCVRCGQWGKKDDMRKRRKGEYRGKYYHKRCYESFKKQNQREGKAEQEGRPLKKRRRKQFLIDSF